MPVTRRDEARLMRSGVVFPNSFPTFYVPVALPVALPALQGPQS